MTLVGRLFAGFAVALVATAALSQVSQQSASAFISHVDAKVASLKQPRLVIRQVTTGTFSGKWLRAEDGLILGTADVKRTESIAEPVQAVVELQYRVRGTAPQTNQGEAETAPLRSSPSGDDSGVVRAIFVPSNGGWAFKSARYRPPFLRDWFDIKAEDMQGERGEREIPHRYILEIQRGSPAP